MSNEITNYFTYGVSSIPGPQDEDRYSISQTTTDLHIASFGVFDGHFGMSAAETCASRLCNYVLKNVASFRTVLNLHPEKDALRSGDVDDAIMCESIYEAVRDVDNRIKEISNFSGTTATTVFVTESSDGAVKVYCANIGNSRCGIFKSGCVYQLSDDHTLNLAREVERFENRLKVQRNPLSLDLTDGRRLQARGDISIAKMQSMYPPQERMTAAKDIIHKLRKYQQSHSWEVDLAQDPSPLSLTLNAIRCALVDQADGIDANQIEDVDLIEDCELKDNFENGPHDVHWTSGSYQGTPDESAKQVGRPIDINAQASSDITKDDEGGEFNVALPAALPDSTLNLHAIHVGEAEQDIDAVSVSTITSPVQNDERFANKHPAVVRRHSVIYERRAAHGRPSMAKFLLSRYNVSTMLTRSLGDVYGPRTCVALPEIVSEKVKAEEYARLILATDGLWDLLTLEEAVTMIADIANPRDAATILAGWVSQRRREHRTRRDDVTCIVIDIHPELFETRGFAGFLRDRPADGCCSVS